MIILFFFIIDLHHFRVPKFRLVIHITSGINKTKSETNK